MSRRTGRLNNGTIEFSEIEIPSFKLKDHRKDLYSGTLTRPRGYSRTVNDQRQVWLSNVDRTRVKERLKNKVGKDFEQKSSNQLIFQVDSDNYLIGKFDQIVEQSLIPKWDRNGKYRHQWHVDHIKELQLGGENTVDNMELLEPSVNMSSGSTIMNNISSKASSFNESTNHQYGKDVAEIQQKYALSFDKAVKGGGQQPGTSDYWTRQEIEDGKHVRKIKYSPNGLRGEGRRGQDNNIYIFRNLSGSRPKTFSKSSEPTNEEKRWLAPYEIIEKQFTAGDDAASSPTLGYLKVQIPKDHKELEQYKTGSLLLEVKRVDGQSNIGYIDKQSLQPKPGDIGVKGASPIRLDSFELTDDRGVVASGAILPEHPLMSGGGVDFSLENGDLTVSKTFAAGDLNVPAPFNVREASLSMQAEGGSGLRVAGAVDFDIKNVGEGNLRASVDDNGGLAFLGYFDFQSSFFDPARVELGYEGGELGGNATLGIPGGKVPGIESATLDVSVGKGRFSGKGSLKPTIQVIKQADITLSHSAEEGMAIEGDFAFNSRLFGDATARLGYKQGQLYGHTKLKIDEGKIPGIGSAEFDVSFAGDSFSGQGKVKPRYPGLDEATVSLSYSPEKGMGFGGGFKVNSPLFEQAEVELAYSDGKISGAGQLALSKSKLPGIESGSVKVSFDGDSGSGEGSIQPTVPGLKEVSVHFAYSPADGYVIGGAIDVNNLPYVTSGSLALEIGKRPGAAAYDINGSGRLQLAIAGMKASARADYKNGLFTVEAQTALKRGLVDGTIKFGVTNRAVDRAGRLLDRQGDQLTPFGYGEVGVQLTDWLKGTAGVRLFPNGEVEINGALKMTDSINLFNKKKFDKNIFKLGFDIPIVGPLVASISGGMDLEASIGPGQLRNAGASVTYNPDHPDKTHLTGTARLVIPASAGLRVFIRGGVGVNMLIGGGSIGLEGSATLGIDGGLNSGIDLEWTPKDGLAFDAFLSVQASPRFRFNVDAFAEAWLAWKSWEVKWPVAAVEYGSNMRLGMKVPIHYDTKNGFEFSWNKVEFEKPSFSLKDLVSGFLDDKKDEERTD